MVEKGREREIYGGASVVYVEPLPNRRPSSGEKEGRKEKEKRENGGRDP